MFRRATRHSAPHALLVSGLVFFGLGAAACNPSPHLDPDGGSGGGGATTITTTTTQQGGGGTGGTGGQGGTTTTSTTSAQGGGGTGECDSNADCSYPKNLCDTAASKCVECVVTSDCASKPGTVCSKAACICPAASEDYCPADGYGPDRCADLKTATKDCGSCGHECFGACNNGQCADAWEPLAKVGAPSPRTLHVAVWTGTKMIVWGGTDGSNVLGDGAMYDPVSRTWEAILATGNAPSPRDRATAVWTGTEMIVWGGRGPGGVPLGDGARFNPVTKAWQMVGTGGPGARFNHTAVWSANPARMIVWGGTDGTTGLDTGAYYVPNDAWSELTLPSAPPTQRELHTAVFDNAKTRMIVFGGRDISSGTSLNTGSLYVVVPMMDNWIDIGQTAATPAPRYEHSAVWAENQMIVWGGYSTAPLNDVLNDGARFDVQNNNEWTPMNGIAPSARRRHSALYFPQQKRMIVWGGYGPGNAALDDGGVFDIGDGTWTNSGVQKGPPPSVDHAAVATDTAMIIWGGSTTGGAILGTGAILTLSKVP